MALHGNLPHWPQLGATKVGPDLDPHGAAVTAQDSRPALQPKLHFIDEGGGKDLKTGKTKRRAVRKHVMQEHMRQKRWKEKGQLDRETILEQRGLQIDVTPDQSPLKHDRVALRPWDAPSKVVIPNPEAEEVEEIPRSQGQKSSSQPCQPVVGKSPDEIDALLANAFTDKDAYSSYFDAQPPASSQWQPSLSGLESYYSSISQLYSLPPNEVAKTRQPSFESNNSSVTLSEDVPECFSDDCAFPESDHEPAMPDTPKESETAKFDSASSLSNTPSPRTPLGGARKDPFSSLPLRLKEHEHQLVDHFITVMPYAFYGVGGRRDLAFNWFRDVIFPIAMESPTSFRSAVLGFACIHRARLQNVITTPELTNQSTTALAMLMKHFRQHPDDCSDEAIANCLIQSCFEDFSPGVDHKASSWVHMHAAMRMIRTRGGPKAIQHSPRLTMLANCYDYRTPGYHGEGLSFSFKQYPPQNSFPLPSNLETISVGKAELRMVTEEFVDFLRSIEHLSLVQRSASYAELSPRRHRVFQSGTTLHAIIASPPGPRCNIPIYQHQLTYGISLLVHLNAALWDFRRDVDLSERFLKDVCLRIVTNELDTYVSVEALAQLMLRPTSDPDMRQRHFDRLWFVGRMIKIAKRLSLESWLKLRGMLIGCLTFEEMPSFFEWEDEFRQEVLGAPLTSFIMPALT